MKDTERWGSCLGSSLEGDEIGEEESGGTRMYDYVASLIFLGDLEDLIELCPTKGEIAKNGIHVIHAECGRTDE
jgi:hypothetical protein